MSKVRDIDRGYKAFVRGFRAVDGLGVTVGVHAEEGSELARIAAAHEYGTRTIPKRSYLRATLDARVDEYRAQSVRALRAALDGKDAAKELDRLGARMAADVRATIRAGLSPALAPGTRRKNAKPLIDTGRLLGAITHKLRRS